MSSSDKKSNDSRSAEVPQPSDDVKQKFREALKRKREGQHDGPAHLDGDSAVQGSQSTAATKRMFRRKTG